MSKDNTSEHGSMRMTRIRYVLLTICGFLFAWSIFWLFFGEDSFWESMRTGVIAALIFTVIVYLVDHF